MCGIAGYISKNNNVEESVLWKMIKSLKHRGPDSQDIWVSDDKKIGLAHSRLSILDLSDNGNQPMKSFSGRYTIVFNGEIYNHIELRKKIHNEFSINSFKSTSDTETLLCCFEVYGLRKTLNILIGMFAFGLYDNKEKKFYLVRDRIGEKPLYYGWQNEYFFFGSELKAIKSNINFNPHKDFDALNNFFNYCYIPSPLSIYKNIKKLKPGSFLEIDIENGSSENYEYWNTEKIFLKNNNKFSGSFNDAVDKLDDLLIDSVRIQKLSDVPLGCFLSSGIDSTLISSTLCKISDNVETFSVGFEDKQYDESKYSKIIAKKIGSNHNELILSEKDVIDTIINTSNFYDEPFADSSKIPTYLLSKFAKSKVTVCLSGDAGDELFGGYNRYIYASYFKRFKKLKPILNFFSEKDFLRIYRILSKIKLLKVQSSYPRTHFQKIKKLSNTKNDWEIYLSLVTNSLLDLKISKETYLNENIFSQFVKNLGIEKAMMLTDALTYLPDDILFKVDRASMLTSLEVRVPFLDHRIIELAYSLPTNYLIDKKNKKGKLILRELLSKRIPDYDFNRPKAGFSLPLENWFRSGLKDWAFQLISQNKNEMNQLFPNIDAMKIFNDHISDKHNNQEKLWMICSFLSWNNQQ